MEQMISDAQWKSISPYELENACKLIGKDWMLVCAGDNAMTASWGGMGILWNKPVSFVFISFGSMKKELGVSSGNWTVLKAWTSDLKITG